MSKLWWQDKAAITGIGQTEYSRGLNRSEWDMAAEAIFKAIDDAGLKPEDIDGLSTFNLQYEGFNNYMHQLLGLGNISYYVSQPHGGGSYASTLAHGALGVAAGQCNHLVAFRSRARGRKSVFGPGTNEGGRPWEKVEPRILNGWQYHVPFGLQSPVQEAAAITTRYMHDYGWTEDHLGNVAVALRTHGSRNPNAVMRAPITLEDHNNSRMISSPLRLLDCCIETDGACAVVVSRADYAKDAPNPPAYFHAYTQSNQPAHYQLTEWFHKGRWDRDTTGPRLGERLFAQSDFTHDQIAALMAYDHFTSFVILSIEDLGFCGRGEGGDFTEGGALIAPGGRLPVNTHGGQHSEAFIHGFNNVVEAARQIRGTSTSQVPDARAVVVIEALSDPCGAFILRSD